jgi:hypothetical protein
MACCNMSDGEIELKDPFTVRGKKCLEKHRDLRCVKTGNSSVYSFLLYTWRIKKFLHALDSGKNLFLHS